MPNTPNMNYVQKKKIQPNTGKSKIKNSTIQPNFSTNSTISNKSPIIISEHSFQVSNMNNPVYDGWIMHKSKRILSSSSFDTSPLKNPPPTNK